MAKLTNKTKNKMVVPNLNVAADIWTRNKGLLGKKTMASSEALFILRCNAIHTFFMNFPIDVAFVNRKMVVKKIMTNVQPWRATWPVLTAAHVIEFAGGTLTQENITVGDQLHVDN